MSKAIRITTSEGADDVVDDCKLWLGKTSKEVKAGTCWQLTRLRSPQVFKGCDNAPRRQLLQQGARALVQSPGSFLTSAPSNYTTAWIASRTHNKLTNRRNLFEDT